MEALQAAGYLVVNQCGLAANQVLTLLSVLHITFQPFFVNAFAMELIPAEVRAESPWWSMVSALLQQFSC